MGRKNDRVGRKNCRYRDQLRGRSQAIASMPAVPIESIVIPNGKCYKTKKATYNNEGTARKALKQAQYNRVRRGDTGHMEQRIYRCEHCNGYHLTSREVWEDRTEKA